MNTDKLVELFREEVEKLEKEAYERGKRDALNVDEPKTVKREAKVGERVLITKAYANDDYVNGDVGTVIKSYDSGGVDIKEWDDYVSYSEYEVIIEEQVQPLSANQQRKELIEQAREFIKNSKGVGGYYEVHDPNLASNPWVCNVEFIVNEEKRTVVALLKGIRSKKVYAKGIAKCHPDEVFNADIGKAIALARALEIDIPKKFLNAVQPDKAAKGMIVYTLDSCSKNRILGIREVVNIRDGRYPIYKSGSWASHFEIINDTKAEYEVR